MHSLTERYRAAVRNGANCANYLGIQRCTKQADGILFDQNAKPIYGGVYCEPCASRAISRYRELLGETWSFEPIEKEGS